MLYLRSYKFIDSTGVLRDKVVGVKKWPSKHDFSVLVPSSHLQDYLFDHNMEATWFDGSSFGFAPTNKSDLLLVPDPTTVHWDPIRGMNGVFCFLYTTEGNPLEADFRVQAKRAMDADDTTKKALFGVEPEFFLLVDKGFDNVVPYGQPTRSWLSAEVDQFEYYGSLPPVDKTQEVRDLIVQRLDKTGLIEVESCHHEVAPSQAEISWCCDSLLGTADRMMLVKYIISATVAEFHDKQGNQAHASFDPKPFPKMNGSGCHVHVSIPDMKHDEVVLERFAQGLVDHYDDLVKVCNTHPKSHLRLVPGFESPTRENNGVGYCDRTKTVRIPAARGRLEFRLPDPTMNPYVGLTKILEYGYEAVKGLK